jgi:fibronectin-binding autotransporter adhesin
VVGASSPASAFTVADATKTGFATVSGGNVVRYTAATTLAAGSDNGAINYVTKVGDAGYAGDTLTLTAATPVNANTLELDTSAGNGVLDLNTKTLAIDRFGLLVTGDNGFTIQNGTLGGGTGGTEELMIHHYGTGTLTISAAAGSGSGFIAKTGPGTIVLSGASTATGTTRVNQGVLRLSHATGGGTGNIGVQAGAALELNGVAVANRPIPYLSGDGIATNGALRCIATSTYGGLITVVNQGGRISADSGTTLTITNGISTGDFTSPESADVTFGGAGDILVSPVKITCTGGVIKDGSGTTELSAANDYTGATTVNGGTLKVSGSIAAGSAVTVNTNGTLTGSGTCSGAVRVNGGGTVKTLTNGATGDKLTVGSLILDAGGIASFEVASGNNADYIDVTTAGTLVDTAGLTIHPGAKVRLSAPNLSGTYNLIKYAGTLKGSVSNLSVDNPAPGGTYVFSTAGGYVVLNATVSAAGTVIVIR